jgi:hypothetical protein
MTVFSPHSVRYSLLLAALALPSGCGDDEPGRLFEEDGTWELEQYNLDGEGLTEISADNRGAAFLMKFKASRRVVQVAMCGEVETDTPQTSLCRLLSGGTAWFCKCYAYAYQEDEMIWREFAPGSEPPSVPFTEGGSNIPPASSGGGDTDTGGETDSGDSSDTSDGGGGDARINLSPVANISSTYSFRPLPFGVWGSDGSISSYVMQQRATSLFDQVLADPEGRPSCTPCVDDI